MSDNELDGTAAVVTGASSGIGAATARQLSRQGASVALVARRKDRLTSLAAEITEAGGEALAIEADIAVREQAQEAVQETVSRFGRLDILINNAGVMLLGPVVGADIAQWERMLSVNVQGLLYMTHAALPHLLDAADRSERRVSDVVNISSRSGRVATNGFGVYNATKFGVNGFTESLRQEVTRRHVRVGLIAPGAVATELVSQNSSGIRKAMTDDFDAEVIKLEPEDVADSVTYMVTRSRRTTIADLLIMPTDQA